MENLNEMEIVYLPISSLTPYARNAKEHPRKQIEQIKRSISDYGMRDPIGIWGKNNTIVEGHGRWMACKELGFTEVPCIRLDDMTDEQRREYALVHNQTTLNSGFDSDVLDLEVGDMPDFDAAFYDFEIQLEDPAAVEDDFEPVVPEEPKARVGDIYQLGRHRLMCGDCTNAEAVQLLMDGAKADMVFTDPPYNIASDSKNFAADCSKAMGDLSNADWDKKFDIKSMFPVLFECLSKDVSVYICTSHFLAADIWGWMREWADHYSYCVWSKQNPMPSLSKRHWTWNTELICYATRGKHTFNFPKEGHALSTWTINKRNGDTGHPTEKPVEVPAMGISHSSKPGDIVLDLFGGSGSTLIACEQTNRNCYMMELDPHYVDVIIERWERFTGEKAVKING